MYLSCWRIAIPANNIILTVIPHQHNQELPLDFTYWEGAVWIEGENISGNGYVELTGYTKTDLAGLNSRRLQN
ncbi:MAG TPA: lipocalin family protein [Thermodesulfobacteriota bacterium]|nr:lipocalin family protein [Thermodesulfobacteriota bacterium]